MIAALVTMERLVSMYQLDHMVYEERSVLYRMRELFSKGLLASL